MKFCPECGYSLNDKTKCKCGFEVGKEVNSNNSNKRSFIPQNDYYDPTMNNNIIKEENKNNEFVPMLGAVKLEELKRRRLDLGKLLEVSYTSSGGMMGSFYNTTLYIDNKELVTTKRTWHHDDTVIRKYRADDKLLNKILKVIDENNLGAWSEIPIDRSKMAYDMESSTMSLRYEQTEVVISLLIYMDEEENKVFFNLRDLIYSIANDNTLISEEIKENPDKQNMMQFMRVTNNKGE